MSFIALFTAWLIWSSKDSFVYVITPKSICFFNCVERMYGVVKYHRIFDFSDVFFPTCLHLFG